MTTRDRFSLASLAVATGLAILVIGGATRWSQALVAVAVGVGLGAVLLSKRAFERRPPLVLLLLALSAWTALQLVPLPAGLVASLSPTLDGLRQDGAALAGVSVWSSISMDPPSTLRALTFLLTLSGVAVIALRVAVSERGRYVLVAVVAGFAGIAAVVAGAHELADATTLYGLYEPRQVPPILGPLLNTNHLGCLTAVGTVTSLGLVLYPKQSVLRRIVWTVCSGTCLVVTMATLSRGAVLGLAMGLVATLAAVIVHRFHALDGATRRRRERFLTTTLPAGVMVACGIAIAVYLGAGSVMQQLETTTLDEIQSPRSKFAAWKSSLELVEDSPVFGVGRGAFETTFTRVHPASAFATFSHAENEAVQVVVDWGIGGALLVLGLGGWTMLLAIRRWRDGPLAAGALGGLATIAFQSNFDFGLELLGLAVPVTILAATLTYGGLAEVSQKRLPQLRALRVAHGLAVLLGAILLLGSSTRTVEEDHHLLRAKPERAVVLDAIAAHPLDYYGFAILAEDMLRAEDANAVRVLNHAMRLHPTHAGLHWVAARMLMRANRPSQAEAEYSTALRFSVDPRPVIRELAAVLPVHRAATALPVDLSLNIVLPTLGPLSAVTLAWLERVVDHGTYPKAIEALQTVALRQKNYPAAERAVRKKCQPPPTPGCKLELASVLQQAGRYDAMIVELADVATWRSRGDERRLGWLMLCDAHTRRGGGGEATECLRRLEASGLVRPDDPDVLKRRDALRSLFPAAPSSVPTE